MSGGFGGAIVRAVRGTLRVWVQSGYAEADKGQGASRPSGTPSCPKT